MDYETNICSWNVRTLHRPGRLEDLRKILQTYEADITALQEIIWNGKGELEDRSRYQCDIYYSCPPKKHEFGVGFAVRGKARHFLTRWMPINAPTEDKDDEVKDIFYDQLEQAYGSHNHKRQRYASNQLCSI